MNIRRFTWWTATAACLQLSSSARCGSSTGALSPAPEGRSTYEAGMRVDPDGTPRVLFRIQSRTYAGSPEEAAREFLLEQAGHLRLEGVSLALATQSVIAAPGGNHVRFQQLHAGIPVYGGDITVSLNASNQVGMVVNNAHNAIHLETITPSMSADEGLRTARSALGLHGNPIGQADQASLVVFQDPTGVWHLAYRVLMTREDPSGDWEVLVDAITGGLLRSVDRFVMHTGEFVQGSGQAYLQDPLTAAGRMYGTPGFSDNNDADSDSLTLYRSPVILDSLTFEDGVYKLNGPYCTVTEIESPADPEYYGAATPDGFSFTRNEQTFEAVNVYFHVTSACRHIESLGFFSARLREIRLDPHGFQGQDNSHFSPSGNWIAWGEGGVDDAEDADVIWHEYGHAIQFALCPTWGGGESGALGEGISDYLAASYAHAVGGWQPDSYHYQWIFNWDGHNPFWAGRVLNDQRTYPFGAIPIHSAGQIVSAALMGIHGNLGRSVTDRLVLKAVCYLGSGVRAPDFAAAMIQADLDVFDGQHLSTLLYWLGTVKHFIDPGQYTSIVESGLGTPAGFSLGRNYPNPFNPSTTISFSLPEESLVRLVVYDITGREVATLQNGPLDAGGQAIRWNAMTGAGATAGSGVYFFRLEADGLRTGAMYRSSGSMVLLK